MVQIGNRIACDKCGRIQSSKLKIFPESSDTSKHICERCKQTIYYQNIEAVAKTKDSTSMH
ncbi:MAG: hypothetical protein ACXAC8_11600 [Candidatus Hodarchaeales archaeon]|jgi:hypothetical protein